MKVILLEEEIPQGIKPLHLLSPYVFLVHRLAEFFFEHPM